MFKLSTAAVTLAAACQVLAHGGVLSYSWGGQWYWGFKPYNTPTGQVTIQREWDTYNPIQDATDPTIACNDAGTALPTGQQLTATAAAGTAITAYWNNPWPHPYGPMLTYMANCNGNCDNANAATLDWFKIDESGLLSGTVGSGTWGSGEMIANNNSWTSTIPSCIPAGNYLLRFETIALHSQPAQWYPECAQLTVTGGGSTVPANTCKLPGCYSNTDPGTDIDIYGQAAQTQTTYVIPGPALFTCGGSNTKTTTTTTKASSTSSTKTSSTTTSIKTATTTTTKTSSTTSKASTTSANGATQTQYGQCGGASYTGPTVCVSPFTCTYSNAYYSQCL
ncbi:hypothetical protein FRC04_002626 [Tulasnella sp. 424]|nr:hypothetical protein FRC04_002626 [Tulasnella sp. 424]KAG8981265.1 hypothetical protein FRC05_004167 [Tulasnella sp. 425]